jgi:hypothetical protein
MPVNFPVKYFLYRQTVQNFKYLWLFGHYLHRCSDSCVFHYKLLLRQWLVKTGLQQSIITYLHFYTHHAVFVFVQYIYMYMGILCTVKLRDCGFIYVYI